MAWYYGNFSCGCEGRVNITGPVKNRQWIADRKFEGLCSECFEKQLEEERENATKEATEKAKEMELPKLLGTEKQIQWAITLRQNLIDSTDEMNEEYFEQHFTRGLEINEIAPILNYILTNKTDAKYYINTRNFGSLRILLDEKEEALKSDKERAKEKAKKLENEKMEKMIREEATVFPEKRLTNSVVEIVIKDNIITAIFEKNDDFIKVVKDLDFTWTSTAWKRAIFEMNGTVEDRASELGNVLLNEGFPIMILDEEIRRKAILGEYKFECTRWIIKHSKTGNLAIKWSGMNDKLYKASRKLPGSKWSSGCTLVNVSHFEEVEEFADLYKFRFSKKALELIEEYKSEISNIEIVAPAIVEKEIAPDGLNDILNSSREILDDLMD